MTDNILKALARGEVPVALVEEELKGTADKSDDRRLKTFCVKTRAIVFRRRYVEAENEKAAEENYSEANIAGEETAVEEIDSVIAVNQEHGAAEIEREDMREFIAAHTSNDGGSK